MCVDVYMCTGISNYLVYQFSIILNVSLLKEGFPCSVTVTLCQKGGGTPVNFFVDFKVAVY